MSTQRRLKRRRGTAAVEFAIVAPLVFLMLFGMIEFGRMLMVQQILTNASREGARRAIIESSTMTEVTEIVTDYLQRNSISGATLTLEPTDLTSVGAGDPVSVSVAVTYDQVSWLPVPQYAGGVLLTGQSRMRAERPE